MGTPRTEPPGSSDPGKREGRGPENPPGLLAVEGREGRATQGDAGEGLDKLSISVTLLLIESHLPLHTYYVPSRLLNILRVLPASSWQPLQDKYSFIHSHNYFLSTPVLHSEDLVIIFLDRHSLCPHGVYSPVGGRQAIHKQIDK